MYRPWERTRSFYNRLIEIPGCWFFSQGNYWRPSKIVDLKKQSEKKIICGFKSQCHKIFMFKKYPSNISSYIFGSNNPTLSKSFNDLEEGIPLSNWLEPKEGFTIRQSFKSDLNQDTTKWSSRCWENLFHRGKNKTLLSGKSLLSHSLAFKVVEKYLPSQTQAHWFFFKQKEKVK